MREFTNLNSVLELEANCHANWLVIYQHGGGYDRGAQDSAQIPDNVQYIHQSATTIKPLGSFNVVVKQCTFTHWNSVDKKQVTR